MTTTIRYLADRLWDGTGPLVRNGALDVTDGVITTAGPADGLPPPAPGGQLRDLGDVTLLPGLIDNHVHVTFSAGDDVVADFAADVAADAASDVDAAGTAEGEAGQRSTANGALMARTRHNLGVALEAGITTVRDLGTPAPMAVAIRRELADGTLRGPAVVTSASPLTTPGGHCHFLSHQIAPGQDPAQAVDLAVEAGADLIKVFASGGNLTPGSSPLARQFDRTALPGVVRAAHRRGLVVAAHAFGLDSVADCAAAGVDTIEHCAFMTPDGPVLEPEVVVRMVAEGIVAVPTLGSGPVDPATVDLDRVPPVIRAKVELLLRQLPKARDAIRALVDAGVQLSAGTDAGIPQRPFDSLAGSIAWFGAADGLGMSAAEALATATWVAARTCGLEDRGRLAPGLRADLLAVRGNPLADLADLSRVALVVLAGEEVVDNAAAHR